MVIAAVALTGLGFGAGLVVSPHLNEQSAGQKVAGRHHRGHHAGRGRHRKKHHRGHSNTTTTTTNASP